MNLVMIKKLEGSWTMEIRSIFGNDRNKLQTPYNTIIFLYNNYITIHMKRKCRGNIWEIISFCRLFRGG